MGLSHNASNEIFNRIAVRYDLVNAVLSFGFHEVWRSRLVRAFPRQVFSVLDLACGTAAIPLAFFRHHPQVTEITGVDISGNMLKVARERLDKAVSQMDPAVSSRVMKVRLIQGDAAALSFEDASFDAVTVGFALRNVPDVLRLLVSACRVLKPNGYFGVLEFSRPAGFLVRWVYWVYLSWLVPLAGLLLTGEGRAYRHLGQSIMSFPEPERFLKMLRQAGFREIRVFPMAFGAVSLYMAKK